MTWQPRLTSASVCALPLADDNTTSSVSKNKKIAERAFFVWKDEKKRLFYFLKDDSKSGLRGCRIITIVYNPLCIGWRKWRWFSSHYHHSADIKQFTREQQTCWEVRDRRPKCNMLSPTNTRCTNILGSQPSQGFKHSKLHSSLWRGVIHIIPSLFLD